MLPWLPACTSPARSCRGLLCAFALAVFGLAPADARAIEVVIDGPHARGDTLWMDVSLSDLFSSRVAQSLARGMPATLQVHAELWRRRTAWFDRLERSSDGAVRIHFEVWSNSYQLERAGAPPIAVASLDSVALVLSRPIVLPVARVAELQPQSRYYVVVSATLKPLSVEDVAEVESWMSGEVETKRRAGFGIITELPRSLFDAVRNFAGFGDQRVRAISGDFEGATVGAPPR